MNKNEIEKGEKEKMNKLKIGDEVVIRPRLTVGKEYGDITFLEGMENLRGNTVRIKNVSGDDYVIDKGSYILSIEMFTKESVRKAIEKHKKTKNGSRVIFKGDELNARGKEGIYRNGFIEFDEYVGGHDGDGTGKQGHCWYTSLDYVELVEDKQEEIIETKEDTNYELLKNLTDSIKDLSEQVNKKDPFKEAMIQGIIEKGKELSVKDIEEKLKKDLDEFIQKNYGCLPKKIAIENNFKKKEISGIFHKEFENICKMISSDIPLMLVGGAGAGKNHTLEQVAEALDLEFYTTNAVNQDFKLTGFIDANGKYHETEFYKAFKDGGLFFLDEIDASCPEALIILNGAIANRYFDFPIGRIKANENFRVVCAGNTYGTGADMVYVGRNVLDGATLDRFVVLQFDYDEQVERKLAFDEELFNFIRDLRQAVNKANLRYIVSMRALINSTKLLEIDVDKKTILETTIIKNMQKDDLNIIIEKLDTNNSWYNELKRLCD